MKSKGLAIATTVLNIGGAVLIGASFFQPDSKKAVHMRWTAVGAFGLALGVRIIDAVAMKKVTK